MQQAQTLLVAEEDHCDMKLQVRLTAALEALQEVLQIALSADRHLRLRHWCSLRESVSASSDDPVFNGVEDVLGRGDCNTKTHHY